MNEKRRQRVASFDGAFTATRLVQEELERAEARVYRLDAALRFAVDAASLPGVVDQILTRMLSLAIEDGDLAETGSVFLAIAGNPRTLRLVAKVGVDASPREFAAFTFDQGVVGLSARTGSTVRIDDCSRSAVYVPFTAGPQLTSIIATPILHLEETKAVICLHNQTPGRSFTDEHQEFLEYLSTAAGVAIAATHHPLSGLPTRNLMGYILGRELEAEALVSVAYLDVDRFKAVNDALGHDVGDLVIAAVGDALIKGLEGEGIACHRHGDEFSVVFPGAAEKAAIELMEKARAAIESTRVPELNGHGGHVTVSVGVACRSEGDTVDSLIANADKALHHAKESGRNVVKGFSSV